MAKKKVTTKAVTTKEEIIDTVDIAVGQQDESCADGSLVSFRNITSRNVFTTLGRVAGGDSICLLPSEGDDNIGLERE